jgi:hypothetical protein
LSWNNTHASHIITVLHSITVSRSLLCSSFFFFKNKQAKACQVTLVPKKK